MLGTRALDRDVWAQIRGISTRRSPGLPDGEFTKTFFSSITRRLFGTVGVDADIEFVATDLDPLAGITAMVGTRSIPIAARCSCCSRTCSAICASAHRGGISTKASRISPPTSARSCTASAGSKSVQKVEIIGPVFYQLTRAYLVGRIIGRGLLVPLVIALKNTEAGLLVDAVMLSEDQVSIVFSFTRSYFHVDLERVAEAVVFLKSMLPRKPAGELFTVLGRAKQGQNRALPRARAASGAYQRPIHPRARRTRSGHGLLHPALL